MNFEAFRNSIESKLKSISEYELLEYHYLPYSFGSGTLAYRINGRIIKFTFDGKENRLTWYKSREHSGYPQTELIEIESRSDFNITLNQLETAIGEKVE
jgi:hypothetical protein